MARLIAFGDSYTTGLNKPDGERYYVKPYIQFVADAFDLELINEAVDGNSNPVIATNVLNFKFTKNSFKVLMKSDCFSRLKKNIFYQRLLEINNKNILISDNIKNHNYSFITLAFHLCPEVKLKKIYNNTFQIRNGPTRLNFKINSKKIKKIKNDYVFDYGKKISTNSFVINNFSKKNFSNKVIIGN